MLSGVKNSMQLDTGYKTYDTQQAEAIFSWKSLIDYDPTSHSLEDAVGDHYTIYKARASDGYFLHFRCRIQSEFMGPVHNGPEYIHPLSREEICFYALIHDKPRIIENEGLENERDRLVEKIISSASNERIEVIRSKRDIFLDLSTINEQVSKNNLPFKDEIKHDLYELQQCLGICAYRAALAISGRLLELSLKLVCIRNAIDFSDKWMVGQLISKITQSGIYLDPSLESVWQIVNQQRIIAVHAKAMSPVPSREQAFMVSFAVIDLLKRLSQNEDTQ